ncbi:MAG: hypothetical protein QM786_18650 [Breznakibacter sp.]
MLEKILKSGGAELISQLGAKFNVDGALGSKILDVSSDTLQKGFTDEVVSGNFDGILSLFNGTGNSAASALSGRLTQSLVGNLLSKVGLKNETALQVAQFVVQFVADKFTKQKPAGGFDASSITDMFKGAAGNLLKDKASDLLKGGLGGLFK